MDASMIKGDPDAWSRLNISLDTDETGHWDEVIAITERVLNKKLEVLWEMYDDLQRVYNDPGFGQPSIYGEMKPPLILIRSGLIDIGDENSNTVLFVIRFTSGQLKLPGHEAVDITGWELAIPTPMGTQQIPRDSPLIQTQKENNARQQIMLIGRVYSFPGDYSIHRLVAQLSSAEWAKPNPDYSTIIDHKAGGKKMTWKQWAPYSKGLASQLSSALATWGTDNEINNRTTLNVKFQVPEHLVNPATPSYSKYQAVPTFVRQQSYPHYGREYDLTKSGAVLQQEIDKKVRENPELRETRGIGYSSLLWCEMVDNHGPPSWPHLRWTGNFVTEPEGSEDGPDGTFALSNHLFLETHILERLRPFNQASDIANLKLEYEWDSITHYTGVKWFYSLGVDSDYPQYGHEKYGFKRIVNKDNLDSPITYVFNKKNIGTPSPNCEDGGHKYVWENMTTSSHWHKHWSDATVTVSWKPGDREILVRGETRYVYQDKLSKLAAGSMCERTLMYDYLINWSFLIQILGIKDGVIQMNICSATGDKGSAGLEVKILQLIDDPLNAPANQQNVITESLTRWFTTNLPILEEQLKKSLTCTAQFTYPGIGQFEFSDPVMSRQGNLLASITYKPLLKQEGYVDVPQITPSKPPSIPDPPIVPLIPVSGHQAPKLTWRLVTPEEKPLRTETKEAHFSIVATNKSQDTIYFGKISVQFTAGLKGKNLLATDRINHNWIKDTEPPSTKKLKAPSGDITVRVSNNKEILINPALMIYDPIETESGGHLWSACIMPEKPDKSSYFQVPAGGVISLDFRAPTSKAGRYPISIQESWRDSQDPTKFIKKGLPVNDDWNLIVELVR